MPRKDTVFGPVWTGGTGGGIHFPTLRRELPPRPKEKEEVPTNTDTQPESEVNSQSSGGDLNDLTHPPKT